MPSTAGLALLVELRIPQLHRSRQLGLPPADDGRIQTVAREFNQVIDRLTRPKALISNQKISFADMESGWIPFSGIMC